jgi:hypothetical protein
LPGSDRDENKEETAIGRQQLRKYSSMLESSLGKACKQQWKTVRNDVSYAVRADMKRGEAKKTLKTTEPTSRQRGRRTSLNP